MFGKIEIVHEPDGNPESDKEVVPAAQLIADIKPTSGDAGVTNCVAFVKFVDADIQSDALVDVTPYVVPAVAFEIAPNAPTVGPDGVNV